LSASSSRHSAERHLRDLKDAKARGYFWRPELAQRAIDFFPSVFTITDGPAAGKPFNLIPYQTFCVGSLMGWVNADGRWRFRSAWIETGKGQAKSPLMAGLGLYAMGWCGFERSQVYSIAANKQTANVLFKDAAAMCRAQVPGYDDDESLAVARPRRAPRRARQRVEDRAPGHRVLLPAARRRRAAVWSAAADGARRRDPRIHHRRADPDLGSGDREGRRQRDDGAGHQHAGDVADRRNGPLRNRAGDRQGRLKDDTQFAFVARVDKADRETVFENEACWAKALPALGVTFPIGNIREQVQTAKTRISTASSCKRLYFGIPTGAADFWIDEESWAAVLGEVDEAELKGCKCWLSLDLSKKNDLTALTATWIGEAIDQLWSKTWYWTTQGACRTARRATTLLTRTGSSRASSRPFRERRSTRRSSRPRSRGSARSTTSRSSCSTRPRSPTSKRPARKSGSPPGASRTQRARRRGPEDGRARPGHARPVRRPTILHAALDRAARGQNPREDDRDRQLAGDLQLRRQRRADRGRHEEPGLRQEALPRSHRRNRDDRDGRGAADNVPLGKGSVYEERGVRVL
jgi:hypothetical protein